MNRTGSSISRAFPTALQSGPTPTSEPSDTAASPTLDKQRYELQIDEIVDAAKTHAQGAEGTSLAQKCQEAIDSWANDMGGEQLKSLEHLMTRTAMFLDPEAPDYSAETAAIVRHVLDTRIRPAVVKLQFALADAGYGRWQADVVKSLDSLLLLGREPQAQTQQRGGSVATPTIAQAAAPQDRFSNLPKVLRGEIFKAVEYPSHAALAATSRQLNRAITELPAYSEVHAGFSAAMARDRDLGLRISQKKVEVQRLSKALNYSELYEDDSELDFYTADKRKLNELVAEFRDLAAQRQSIVGELAEQLSVHADAYIRANMPQPAAHGPESPGDLAARREVAAQLITRWRQELIQVFGTSAAQQA